MNDDLLSLRMHTWRNYSLFSIALFQSCKWNVPDIGKGVSFHTSSVMVNCCRSTTFMLPAEHLILRASQNALSKGTSSLCKLYSSTALKRLYFQLSHGTKYTHWGIIACFEDRVSWVYQKTLKETLQTLADSRAQMNTNRFFYLSSCLAWSEWIPWLFLKNCPYLSTHFSICLCCRFHAVLRYRELF